MKSIFSNLMTPKRLVGGIPEGVTSGFYQGGEDRTNYRKSSILKPRKLSGGAYMVMPPIISAHIHKELEILWSNIK